MTPQIEWVLAQPSDEERCMTEHKHHGHKPHQDEDCTPVEEDGDFSTLDSGDHGPPPPPPPPKQQPTPAG